MFLIGIPLGVIFPISIGLNWSGWLGRGAAICCMVFMVCCFMPAIAAIFFGKFNIVGLIKLDAFSISYLDKHNEVLQNFLLKDISGLSIIYRDSERNYRIGYYWPHGGDGVGNYIKFKDKEGRDYTYEFRVDDERKLKRILHLWKEENIPFHFAG